MRQFVLTPRYKRQLELLQSHRPNGPTVSGLLRRNILLLTSTFAIGLGAFLFFVWGGWPDVGYMFLGAAVAAFGRDVGRFRMIVRSWPLNEQITNWQRVEDLLRECDRSAS